MNFACTYDVMRFNLSGLNGISDRTLELHLKLYEGYVRETNRLTAKLAEFLDDRHVDHAEMPVYSELKRRLGYEYNGKILHELYFGNLKRYGSPDPPHSSAFRKSAESSFGSYEIWRTDFCNVTRIRGVGWAVCFQDPSNGHLSNHWITLHEVSNVVGFLPVLALDLWEHAYLLDHPSGERTSYVDAYFANVNWQAIDDRLRPVARVPAGEVPTLRLIGAR